MYHTILTVMVITIPFIASLQDLFSLSVYRFLWIAALAVVFAAHGIFNFDSFFYHAGVSAVSFVFYYLIRFITKKGFGFADVLMASFMGSLLSFEKMIYAVIIQIIISLLCFVIARIFTKKRKLKIPFIPVMTASLWCLWFNIL